MMNLFLNSGWLCNKVEDNPTRLSPKDEFKAETLRIVTDMLKYINNKDMSVAEKYQFITDKHVPMLHTLCLEDYLWGVK